MSRRFRRVALMLAALVVLGTGVAVYLQPWCVSAECRSANWTADRTSVEGFVQTDRQYLQSHVELVLVGPADHIPNILLHYRGPVAVEATSGGSSLYEHLVSGQGDVHAGGVDATCGILLMRLAQGRAPLPDFDLSGEQAAAVRSGQPAVLVLSVRCSAS